MRLEDGVVRGLGDAPFLLVDSDVRHERVLRDWGLCDKRAKAYATGGGPGQDGGRGRDATAWDWTACRSCIESKRSPARSTWSTWSRRRTSPATCWRNPSSRAILCMSTRSKASHRRRWTGVRVHHGETAATVRAIRRRLRHGWRRVHRGVVRRVRAIADPAHAIECDLRAASGHERARTTRPSSAVR